MLIFELHVVRKGVLPLYTARNFFGPIISWLGILTNFGAPITKERDLRWAIIEERLAVVPEGAWLLATSTITASNVNPEQCYPSYQSIPRIAPWCFTSGSAFGLAARV